jgi:starvation-inducible DNA-binding protein
MRAAPPDERYYPVKIDTGIQTDDRERVAGELSVLLASSYTLYLKTHNFHWNVKGPMFQTLHTMFELHYTELAIAVDTIAERIRAVGHPAPGTYAAFSRLSTISEAEGVPKALEMIETLVEGHEAIVRAARKVLAVGTEAGDDATVDLATQRLQVHEKTAWMLRSLLEE